MCDIKLALSVLTFQLIGIASAAEYCHTSGQLIGIIIGSVFVTLVVVGLSLLALWHLWRRKVVTLDFVLNKKKSVNTKADIESIHHEYAYDNPYFKEDEVDADKNANQTLKETKITIEGKVAISEENKEEMKRENIFKQRNGEMTNKDRFVKGIPLSSVLNHIPMFRRQKQDQQKSADDSVILEKPERLEVELTGHDFTGLGFNICGNMKEGIFIKDVFNRGPANESGKIRTGDRIISVKVSFEKMVVEDADSILSYSSPYNVCLELEKAKSSQATDSITNKSVGKRLLHPLYRSHSMEELTQIAKESSLSERSTSSSGRNMVQKLKSQLFNRKSNSHLITDDNANEKSKETKDSNVRNELSESALSSDTSPAKDIEVIAPQQSDAITSEANSRNNCDINANNSSIDSNVEVNVSVEKVPEANESESLQVLSSEAPVPVSRKHAPAKRKGKAPQPPLAATNQSESQTSNSIMSHQTSHSTIETTAQVHNEENQCAIIDDNINTPNIEDTQIPKVNGNISDSSDSISSEDRSKTPSEAIPVPPQPQSQSPQRVQSPAAKHKSSSLSDLTYNHNHNKVQSSLLERAVSLDLNAQSLPEENLTQIGKNLLVDEDTTDSMPLVHWHYNKEMSSTNSQTNSSESTLNDANQSSEAQECVNGTAADNSIQDINGHTNDNTNVNTNFDNNLYQTTSTPVRMSGESAIDSIDQYINLDITLHSTSSSSSSSHSNDESEDANDSTLVNKNNSIKKGTPSRIPQLLKFSTTKDNKEVIEISRNELDDVMMSHKAFLVKQAEKESPNVSSAVNLPPLGDTTPLDFESWTYMSDDGKFNAINEGNEQNISDTQSTFYTTALDISCDNNNTAPKKLPEIAGITLKTGANGQLASTNTLIINTNNDSPNSSFTTTNNSSN